MFPVDGFDLRPRERLRFHRVTWSQRVYVTTEMRVRMSEDREVAVHVGRNGEVSTNQCIQRKGAKGNDGDDHQK